MSSRVKDVCTVAVPARLAALAGAAALSLAGGAGAEELEARARSEGPASHQLVITTGAALLHASDANESSAERGRFLLGAGYLPLPWLEVAARWADSVGPWDYVSANPALGGGIDRLHAVEHLHAIDLGARIDVIALAIDGAQPYHVWPYLGLTYLGLQSRVFASQAFGGGGGVGASWDLDPRTAIDGSFHAMRSFTGGGDGSAYGELVGLWSWTGGVSLGATDWSRLRIAYVGEALDRAHTRRVSHGVQFTFQVSLL